MLKQKILFVRKVIFDDVLMEKYFQEKKYFFPIRFILTDIELMQFLLNFLSIQFFVQF